MIITSKFASYCPDCKKPIAVGEKVEWTPGQKAKHLACGSPEVVKQEAVKQQTIASSRAVDANVNIPVPSGLSYLPFQKAGIAFAMNRPATLIADEMGLGKTIQGLGIINSDTTINRVLVIAPASLKINWQREAEKWLVRKFEIRNIESPEDLNAPASGPLMVIVNYDKLITRKNGGSGQILLAKLMAQTWDLLLADEAHYVKNPKSKRTIAVLGREARKQDPAIPGLVSCAKRKALLTGTPLLNKPIEMFPMLHALDPVTFGNFFSFAKRYCNAHQESVYVAGGFGQTKLVWNFDGASNLPELQEKLRSTVMVRRLKKDVLKDLPPKARQVVVLPQNGAAKAVAAEAKAYAAHEDKLDALQAQVELAQAEGNQSAYETAVRALHDETEVAFTEMSRLRHEVAVAKIPQCIEHIDDALEETDKIIVFAHHHDVVNALAEHYGNAAVVLTGETPLPERQKAVDRFQTDATCRVFIGSIKAAGVGLTLTASSTVIFCELDWVPANMTQAEDRAHRIGQLANVLIQLLVVDGSLDARMANTIVDKQNIADRALDKMVLTQPVIPTPKGEKAVAHPKEYPVATPGQKSAAKQAMQMLAGICDGAASKDGAGFNKMDTTIGKKLAYQTGDFTNGQTWLAAKLANKYRRQLPSELLAKLG